MSEIAREVDDALVHTYCDQRNEARAALEAAERERDEAYRQRDVAENDHIAAVAECDRLRAALTALDAAIHDYKMVEDNPLASGEARVLGRVALREARSAAAALSVPTPPMYAPDADGAWWPAGQAYRSVPTPPKEANDG